MHEIVMVTGAAGFIGLRVAKSLARRGATVIAVDNLYVGRPLPTGAGIIAVEADIRNRARIASLVKDYSPNSVLHLAAVHHIPTCERDPFLAFDVNVMGTQSLLDAIAETNCEGLVMASSGAVYDFSDGPLVEGVSPLRARDVYATTKLTNEYQLETWANRVGKRAQVGRLFNTIGHDDPNGHLIPEILAQLSPTNSRIRVGNITPKRDYVFVDDAAAGFIKILDNLEVGKDFEAFNICRGEEFSVEQLIKLIGETLGKEISLEIDPQKFRKVDRMSQLGNTEKTTDRLGWSADLSLKKSIKLILEELGYVSQ